MTPSHTRLIVPLTQTTPAEMRQAMHAAVTAGADMVELRLDFLREVSDEALHLLLDDRPCPVLATCRSAAEGGHSDLPAGRRAAILTRAAKAGVEWIDFELACLDAAGDLLEQVAPPGAIDSADVRARLIVSSHDFQGRPADLAEILGRMEARGGHVNKIVFAAHGADDGLAALEILRTSRKPAIALAMGPAGLVSRILARKFGAFGTFAALTGGAESAPGQPTIHDLQALYRWDKITPATRVFGVIGWPLGHSLSPAVHNAAFAADAIDAVYVPLNVPAGADGFNRFIDAVADRPWAALAGVSVTIPHKQNALARVGNDNVDDLARAIGAINTVCFTGRAEPAMRGYNTDYAAAIDALVGAMGCAREDLTGRRVAVLGAGGAARAIIAALAHYGAITTVYNRTVSRAEQLAEEFGRRGPGTVEAAGRRQLQGLSAEIVINCTPIGMHPDTDACPLPEDLPLPARTVVFDTIYNPLETRLLARAAAAGCRTVSGVDMFVNQAAAQYEIWTSRPAPRQAMRQAVLAQLT